MPSTIYPTHQYGISIIAKQNTDNQRYGKTLKTSSADFQDARESSEKSSDIAKHFTYKNNPTQHILKHSEPSTKENTIGHQDI
jgi:hypothetical protein